MRGKEKGNTGCILVLCVQAERKAKNLRNKKIKYCFLQFLIFLSSIAEKLFTETGFCGIMKHTEFFFTRQKDAGIGKENIEIIYG